MKKQMGTKEIKKDETQEQKQKSGIKLDTK